MLYEHELDPDGVFELVPWPEVESEVDVYEFELEPLPLADEGLPV